MRAFEILTKADYEIRGSAQPRFHLEMALLRWIHLRRLVPISDLIQGLEKGGPAPSTRPAAPARSAAAPARPAPRPPVATASMARAVEARKAPVKGPGEPAPSPDQGRNGHIPHVQQVGPAEIKDAFLAEIRKAKKFFYGTVVAQAQRIDVETDRVVFMFAPQHRALRAQLDQARAPLETLATELAGRRMAVISVEGTASSPPGQSGAPTEAAPGADRKAELKQQALADSGVQALLDVFAAEIRDVEEIDGKS